MDAPQWIEEVLAFWFAGAAEGRDAAALAEAQAPLWWGGGAEADAQVRARFAALHERACRGALDGDATTPRATLALVLVLDQFSRNLHRGTAAAFAADAPARRWTLRGLDAGADAALSPIERVFFYLPLEHSEDLAHQQRCVALFEQLVAEVPAAQQPTFERFADFARRHREIIGRFGRFPHRNAALGRSTTAAEAAFLREPGSSF